MLQPFCKYPTQPDQVNQRIQGLNLLNDVVVQLQFCQILKLPKVVDLQDV